MEWITRLFVSGADNKQLALDGIRQIPWKLLWSIHLRQVRQLKNELVL
jgi:hypothetical protein